MTESFITPTITALANTRTNLEIMEQVFLVGYNPFATRVSYIKIQVTVNQKFSIVDDFLLVGIRGEARHLVEEYECAILCLKNEDFDERRMKLVDSKNK